MIRSLVVPQKCLRLAPAKRVTSSPGARCHFSTGRSKSTLSASVLNDASHLSDATSGNPDKRLLNPIPDFSDSQSAYKLKSTAELLRASLCFQMCRIPILVRNAETVWQWSRSIFGSTLTNAVVERTFFAHFCGGQDDVSIQPVRRQLEAAGIGSILDYAAEDDGSSSSPSDAASSSKTASVESEEIPFPTATPDTPPTSLVPTQEAREYDYESEAQCDAHVKTFKKCIEHAANSNGADGFAAIKVTALGNPKLLARVSLALLEAKRLFLSFDTNQDGWVSREEFEEGYKRFFRPDDRKMKEWMDQFDPDMTGKVDYITWSLQLSPRDLPQITSNCLQVGPLALATPTEEEIELLENMQQRGYDLAETAAKNGTRLLIDAEQTKFQPAIDNLVLDLQRKFNATSVSDFPIIYNTYQCYLVDALERLQTDVERAERFDYHFGCKFVRGAYMEHERQESAAMGYASPIHETIEDTHKSYNAAVDYLMKKSAKAPPNRRVEFMCATHNQESIEKAVESMNRHGIDRKDSIVSFAQLLGMSDMLSFNLGKDGYRCYKYLPYGKVDEVMPYLFRRARENSSIAGGAAKELRMINAELRRRLSFF